jgi:hypothetical protein
VKESLKENEVLCKKQKLELKEIEKTNFSIENGQKEEILEFIEKLMTLDVEQKLAVFSQTCDAFFSKYFVYIYENNGSISWKVIYNNGNSNKSICIYSSSYSIIKCYNNFYI